MTGLRAVLITGWFWPLADETARIFARLAVGLRARGVDVTILTCRGSADWPERVEYQGLPVFRLPHPHRRRWRSLWYLVALGRWLRTHRAEIDVVCVSRLRSDASAALRALRRSRIPVVLRAEASGPDGDCHWQRQARFGSRVCRRCRTADAIVVPDAAIESELLASGYTRDRLVRVANGVPGRDARNVYRRERARAALADANPDLALDAGAPLVVHAGRFGDRAGLWRLLQAWRTVLRRRPTAKLWLIGEGPQGDEVRDDVVQLDLQRQVVLPGLFDDLGDVLQAADLYVDPGDEPGASTTLLESLATGLPVVATHRRVAALEAGLLSAASLVPAADAGTLADAMLRCLSSPPSPAALAQTRAQVLRHHSARTMIDGHLDLFQRLIEQKAARRP